jgi:KaiC/GvpD/RAD55 family RecA-like ATPase
MSERNVLAVLANNREAFELYHEQLETDDFTQIGSEIFRYIGSYYENDPAARQVDPACIRDHLDGVLVGGSGQVNGLLDFHEVSVPNAAEAVRKQVLRQRGQALADILLTGDPDHATLNNALDIYHTIYTNQPNIHGNTIDIDTDEDILSLLESVRPENKLSVYPSSLNEHLEGGLTPASTVVIAGRPEMGKTLMTINMAAGFAHDGHKVLYVGNEDPKKKMVPRILQRFAMMTKHEVRDKPKTAIDKARERGFNNLVFSHHNKDELSCPQLDRLIAAVEPEVVIVDQIFGLHVPGQQTGELPAIRQIAASQRRLASKHDVVYIGITQIGDKGENQRELGMSHLEGVKTALQAEEDVIILLGGNENMKRSGHRNLCFPKNKESGNHDSLPVIFDDAYNRVRDV